MKFILVILVVCSAGLVAADKICAVRNRDIQSQSNADADGIEDSFNINNHNQTNNDVKFEKCNDYCYAFWREENTSNGTIINIFSQGCWNQGGHDCENPECIGNRWTKALTNGKFCCCKGDYCNVNVTDPYENKLLLTSPATTEYLEQPDSEHLMLIIVTTLACILLITLTVGVLIYIMYKNNLMMRLGKSLPYDDNYNEGNGLKTGTYTFDHLKLSTIVGEGRYGSVWQGSMGDQEVAVKIFPGHYQSYFMNERDIYRLPFMEHSSLLHYYGSDERVSMDGNTEYLLVFSYAPGGTLTDFLRYHTFDWMAFSKMGLSIVKGLAYLHTDYRKGDKFKPCVAHRDMNSSNILIKADGTCCICDLGLAVQISGSKYFSNGEEQHAETKSINDVGTLLYMAPEVLEGAVNLRDCESSLKQIDVYAMGLILWELVSQCSDIYVPGSEVPPYRLPFEKEIGLYPTFEQMQVLVSRNKARPMLEGNVADKPGVRLIRETMEDCWDSDAEARLTALCIEERLMELQSHQITMYFTDGSPMINSHCGLVPSTTNSLYNDAPHHDVAHHHHVVQMESKDVTVDNLVTLSPAESSSHEHSAKNSNEIASSVQQQQLLQPYQGRNPCLERNLMLQSDSCEELDCRGNVLVNKSSKHCTSTDSQSLVPHDILGHHQQLIHAQQQQQQLSLRPVTPIPYVQNVISECSSGSTSYNKLKQTNVQESCYTAPIISDSPRKRRFSGWSNLKKILASKKMAHHQPAYTRCHIEREDSKSNLLASKNQPQQPRIVEKADNNERPSTLPLVQLRKKSSLESLNEVVSSNSNVHPKDSSSRTKTASDLSSSTHKIRRGGQAARFSLYDDRIMCNILTETDDDTAKESGVSSSSVPDFGDEQQLHVAKDFKDVTCF
ncbi:bone morphogenetic protein receptor type-2 isoform X2 [Phymastichus coffea]|uniref:bone morphogenetic protein receptor type-2 isoform X2 n=1 Tax=Phymastichus coffea TaxID=108790 RepID=UPI00273C940B|nr:bone morphogenetic protein receptor type-2 isoform X2 [Phymastichus coffea]